MRNLKKLLLCGATLGVAFAGSMLVADEGQWLPEQIRHFDWEKLRERGLELTAEQIWNGEEGLLSAAVNINGCSASFVSPEGLIATNHHCGYGAINALSTTERNFLQDGFVAGSKEEELPASGYRVSIVRRIEDVTEVIHAAADAAGEDPSERYQAVQAKVRELVAEGEKEPNTNVIVTNYYDGREWRRIFRSEFRDVRLVYAPPAMVGEYGGDIDNWMWPRHTGDFTFFRAYAAPDGSPATYSPDNVPFRPEHWLRVSEEGVREDDLVMIMGYPGRTERYLSSLMVEAREAFFFPRRLELYTRLIEALRQAGENHPPSALKLASRIKSLANRQKNAEGMVWGLDRNKVVNRKKTEEAEFNRWVQANAGRTEAYGGILSRLMEIDQEEIERQEHDFVLSELSRQSTLLSMALRMVRFGQERLKQDMDRAQGYQDRDLEGFKASLANAQRSLVLRAEVGVLAELFQEAAENLSTGQRIKGFDVWLANHQKGGESLQKLAERLVRESRMKDLQFRMRLVEEGRAIHADNRDPLLQLALAITPDIEEQREFSTRIRGERMDVGSTWIQAQQEWRGGNFYPDANRSLRVSVASVKGYVPRDGVLHTPHTTVEGLLHKHNGEEPFDAPASLQEAAAKKDWGAWCPKGFGSVPVCFLSDGDTTGGNSGSPVVNGKGELVGLNFDRVFENVAGDYGWNPQRSRNISVDVRFVLWHLDKVVPAHRLLEEMGVEVGKN